jgi:hypothetical protein
MLRVDPWNTQEFPCFHRIHALRMTRELKPFLCCFCTFLDDFLHHSAKEIVRWLSTKLVRFNGCKMLNQKLPGEDARSEQMLGGFIFLVAERTMIRMWKSPFFCKLSAVQQRLRIASHTKVLHLLGAQAFHNLFHGSNCTAPTKKAL